MNVIRSIISTTLLVWAMRIAPFDEQGQLAAAIKPYLNWLEGKARAEQREMSRKRRSA